MHDKHGAALHPGDFVRRQDGKEFHVNGYVVEDPSGAPHRGSVAFASDVELITKHPRNEHAAPIAGDCIIWGNGQPDPVPPPE